MGQQHTSSPAVLDRRTLARDHRCLAALLRPGMAVLDVGCGTGAITVGIAEAVGPSGRVVGIDRDPTLLARARARPGLPVQLGFEEGDVLALDRTDRFDVATAARVLQWIAEPLPAIRRMRNVVRRGGLVVLLDYSHADLVWEPEPPAAARRFYDAFLAWRVANRWDNRMGDRLADLCGAAGLHDVRLLNEDEAAIRGEPGFDDATAIWERVLEDTRPQLVGGGFLAEADWHAAHAAYRAWRQHDARHQRMTLRAVTGVA